MTLTIAAGEQTREWVSFTDSRGHAEMYVDTLLALADRASHADSGKAHHGGRAFDRDVLAGVVSALAEWFPCENPAHEGGLPGTESRVNGAWFCGPCSSANDDARFEVA